MNEEESERVIEAMRAAFERIMMAPAPAWVEPTLGPGAVYATIDGAEFLCSEDGAPPSAVYVPAPGGGPDEWITFADYLAAREEA